jgi:hypothetical protein
MIDTKDIIFPSAGINIHAVLEKYPDAVYVGQAPLRTKFGFADSAGEIFYTATPDVSKGHSNYFGFFVRDDDAYVTDASHVESLRFTFVKQPDGRYIYARYQHDFRSFGDGCFVDGGAWIESNIEAGIYEMWGRTSLNDGCEKLQVKILNGKFVVDAR